MHPVGQARNGATLYVDLINSEAAKNISHQPHLLTLIVEILPQISLTKPKHIIEHNLGRNIGYDYIVKTTAGDAIFYAKPVKESTYSRFVKNAKPPATPFLTMHLKRGSNGSDYILQDIRIGRSAPPQPDTAEETALSKPYWADHAFIFDNQSVQSHTLTKDCPY